MKLPPTRRIVILWLPLTAGALLVSLIVLGVSTSRAATETPEYEVVERDGNFEIRDYPELVLAQTAMPERDRMNTAFGRLFRYISGENTPAEKIAMTTPVFMGVDGENMAFILPRKHRDAPPDPTGQVSITNFPSGRFAVLRFSSNGRSPDDDENAEQALRKILAERELVPKGEPVIAYYDPPWIPRWFRRHEVLLRLKE